MGRDAGYRLSLNYSSARDVGDIPPRRSPLPDVARRSWEYLSGDPRVDLAAKGCTRTESRRVYTSRVGDVNGDRFLASTVGSVARPDNHSRFQIRISDPTTAVSHCPPRHLFTGPRFSQPDNFTRRRTRVSTQCTRTRAHSHDRAPNPLSLPLRRKCDPNSRGNH